MLAALSTCDPGDINAAIKAAKQQRVRVSGAQEGWAKWGPAADACIRGFAATSAASLPALLYARMLQSRCFPRLPCRAMPYHAAAARPPVQWSAWRLRCTSASA